MSKVMSVPLFFLCFHLLASAQTTVKGKVVGMDARPMLMAHVFLTQPEELKPQKSVLADKSGRFRVSIDSVGVWVLHFTGVGHRDLRVVLYIERPQTIEMNVKLGGYTYLRDFSRAKIVGDFNRWYVLSAVPMQWQTDGTYMAEIETHADSVAYQLNGVRDGNSVEGTQASRYVFDAARGYVSILDVKPGKVKITFDPRRLSRLSTRGKVSFVQASAVVARFAAIYDELQHYQEEYIASQRDFLRSGRVRNEFRFDWSGPISSFDKQIKIEKVRALREELCLSRITIAMIAKQTDASMCSTCLREISPASRVWSLNAHCLFYVLSHSGWPEVQRDEYVQRVLDNNPDGRVKAALLYDLFMEAKLSLQSEKANKYYDLLLSRYGNTPEATMIKQQAH